MGKPFEGKAEKFVGFLTCPGVLYLIGGAIMVILLFTEMDVVRGGLGTIMGMQFFVWANLKEAIERRNHDDA
jgi:hypothetical protein